MDVFVMIMRKNTTLFLDADETTSISKLKLMIQGILKVAPEEQRLYFNKVEVEDNKTLGECGLNKTNAGAHCPASFGLAIGTEELEITPLSSPPEFPDVMKNQEASVETACA